MLKPMLHFLTKVSSVILLLLLAGANQLFSQDQINISTGGTVFVCGGAFLDSGLQAADYSANENYTMTLCPETEGDVVWVEFLSADIACPNAQNNCDRLEVFDGDTSGANSMGTVTGSITFTASPLNTSGCLTFVFTSNGQDEGAGFSGIISCETPCDRPYAIATTDPGGDFPIKVCMNEEITFDGTASTVADGQVIDSWEWDFRDGTTADTPVATHSYSQPGEYIVQLYLIDDNGCASTNRTDIQIWVTTPPNFEFEYPMGTRTCLGDTLCLWTDVEAIPVQYNANPSVDFGGGITVPDQVGECFDSNIEMNSFSPGQTLTNINDLQDIYVNMEHSFIGDLLIQIICPDGTTVNLHEQGGGGVNLGEANQADDEVPGIGYDYWWDVDATLGTWQEESAFGGGQVENNILQSDYYSTVGNLSDLVGCPLNGIWSLSICDLWGADDGTVFEWALNFEPSLYPSPTEFTPSYGAIENDSDSTYWSGPYMVEADPGLDFYCVVPEEVGFFDYTYTVTNDFGCEFDSVVSLEVYQSEFADAGIDWNICGDDNLLQGGILGGELNEDCSDDAGSYTYCYDNWEWTEFNYCPDAPGTMMSVTFTGGELGDDYEEITVYDGENTWASPVLGTASGDLEGQTFTATNATGCLTFVINSNGYESCADGSAEELAWEIYCGDLYTFNWSPEASVSDPSDPNAEVIELTFDGIYTLEVYPTGHEVCATQDDVLVTPAFDFDWEIQSPSCIGDDGFIEIDVDESTGPGPWTYELYVDGDLQEEIISTGEPGLFDGLVGGSYTASVVSNGCSYDINAELLFEEPMIFEVSNDTIVCIEGTAELEAWATLQDPDGSWNYVWDQGLGEGNYKTVSPEANTTYSVYAIDDFGCESDPLDILVELYDPLIVTIEDDSLICENGTAWLKELTTTGGFGSYNYSWSYEGLDAGSGSSVFYNPAFPGTACLTVTDQCESPSAIECLNIDIEVPLAVEIEATVQESCPTLYTTFNIPIDPTLYQSSTWSMGDGNGMWNESQFDYEYIEPGNYDVGLELISPIGCVYSEVFPDFISVWIPPTADFSASPQPTKIPDTEISFYDQSIGDIVSYSYVFDTTNVQGTSSLPDPVFTFPFNVAGEYMVSLTVIDEQGCTDKKTETIVIDDILNLFVPNAFTPNGDGINDVFFVTGTDIDPDKYSLMVFNRWGEVVYETNDLNDVWEGEVKEGDYYYAPDQVYSWKIVLYSLTTQEREDVNGTVTILR